MPGLLFVGVTLFAAAVLLLFGRSPRWFGAVALTAGVCCLLRFTLEVLGRPGGVLDALAPSSFLAALVAGALRAQPPRLSPCPDRRCPHRLA